MLLRDDSGMNLSGAWHTQVTAVRCCSQLSSALTAGMRTMGRSACRFCPASYCHEWTFSLPFPLKKGKETAARICLGLNSFWQRNIKTRSLNSERSRDRCRYNLGNNKPNKIKFSTSVWYLLLSECQKPMRLTCMNLSTDSGSKQHCPAASQGKNISIEIKNECLWGRRGNLSEISLKLHTIMKDSLLFQS